MADKYKYWCNMLAVRFRIRNTNGRSPTCKEKGIRTPCRWPCHKDFLPLIPRFSSFTLSKVRRPQRRSVGAFRHKAGKGYLCARCVMEVC